MTTSQELPIAPPAGCGLRLRNAREAAGLHLEEVATRLKMPVRVVRALESDDWDRAGAAVFVRGQLRSYAKLLGINIDDAIETAGGVRQIEPSEIVSHVHTPPLQRMFEQTARRLVYVVMTAVIVVPVWMMATRGPLGLPTQDNTARLDPPSRQQPAHITAISQPRTRERAPVIASLAPTMPAQTQAAALTLRLNGDSWMEVEAPDGRKIEQGLLSAGTQRSYANGEVARMVIGNASEVEVLKAGQIVDTQPFRRANVARFTVSSDGSLAPE